MAFDPESAFGIGQKIGKSKQSSLGRTSDYMSDLFKERDKQETKTTPMELLMLKSSIQSPLDKARIENLEAKTNKLEDPSSNLSVSQQIAKDKRTQAIFDMVESNKVKKGFIERAKTSLPNIPGGRIGKFQIGIMKQFDQDNPILKDWQNLKSVLTDATLMNTAKTKGAISDREMELFAQASANDDLVSVSRMGDALDRLKSTLDASEKSAMGSYKQIYNEDPSQWFDENAVPGGNVETGNKKEDARTIYNRLRAQGVPKEEAKIQAGI